MNAVKSSLSECSQDTLKTLKEEDEIMKNSKVITNVCVQFKTDQQIGYDLSILNEKNIETSQNFKKNYSETINNKIKVNVIDFKHKTQEAILIKDNYCINDKKDEKKKKITFCNNNSFCNVNKKEKINDKSINNNADEILYKNDIYHSKNSKDRIKNKKNYNASNYLNNNQKKKTEDNSTTNSNCSNNENERKNLEKKNEGCVIF